MNKQVRSRKFTAKQSARFGAYLAAGLTASTVATSDAAIVTIDIGPTGFNIGGINGGGTGANKYFPDNGEGTLYRWNASGLAYGLSGGDGLEFAINGGLASPRNFAFNQAINGGGSYSADMTLTSFRSWEPYPSVNTSPDFGPGSYMGFKTATGNYGWLEVTWTSATSQFQILSGAYEDQVGVSILAGDTGGPAAVPEPGTWAAAALLAGGAAFARWRRRRDEAQKEAA